MRTHTKDSGFTLIELLTVIATIGVLSAVMISGFSVYKASAAYAVATSSFHNARNSLEVALSQPDSLPAAVSLTSQAGPGGMSGSLRNILPGMQLPKQTKISMAYDPTCLDDTCTESLITVKHCQGKEYVTWTRAGDGLEVMLQHVSGAGC